MSFHFNLYFWICSAIVGTRFSQIFKKIDAQIHTNTMFITRLHASYVFWSVFVKNEGPGSIFGRFSGSSKNIPKSIGICPESLISHLGIINPPKKTEIPLNNQKMKTRIICLPYFGPKATCVASHRGALMTLYAWEDEVTEADLSLFCRDERTNLLQALARQQYEKTKL